MNTANGRAPVVLAISGHDPTGAAGVQADIEAIAGCGARCASLVTALTAQNTGSFAAVFPQPVAELRRAADLLLADITFTACKVGLIGAADVADLVTELLRELGSLPIVIDPVLSAGTGTPVADARTVDVYRRQLLAACTVATPNSAEARLLGESADARDSARRMMEMGAANVLVTGGDESTPRVVNILYTSAGDAIRYEFERIPGKFHGSGCTLSAAIAAFLARGAEVETAVRRAQAYTHRTLLNACAVGRAQLHPDRFQRPPDDPS